MVLVKLEKTVKLELIVLLDFTVKKTAPFRNHVHLEHTCYLQVSVPPMLALVKIVPKADTVPLVVLVVISLTYQSVMPMDSTAKLQHKLKNRHFLSALKDRVHSFPKKAFKLMK